MATIFHIALASDWAAAEAAGAYTVSTRGRSLADVGFIHASRADQWPGVRDAFYADVTEPLVLLQIDTDLLDVPLVEEAAGAGGETFPHLYGPLRTSAVVRAMPLPAAQAPPAAQAAVAVPDAAAEPGPASGPLPSPESQPAPRRASPADFSSMYLREMFANTLVVSVVLLAVLVGLGVGAAIGGDVAVLCGALGGLVVGGAVARWLYVRRQPS